MPETKKLFPGMTQRDLEKQKLNDAKAKAAAIAAEQSAAAERNARLIAEEREKILQKNGINMSAYKKSKREAIWGAIFGGTMGVALYMCLSFCVNGFIDEFAGKEDVGGHEWVKSVVNPVVDGKFAPTGTWYRQLAFLLVSLIVTFKTVEVDGRSYREDKAVVDSVDMMLNIKKFGAEYNLNTHQVKRLLKKMPYVIQKMSAEERVYFDMLMKDEINIQNKKAFQAMAVAIMAGHLENHPEDAQSILDVFNEESIPTDLLTKIKYKAGFAR